MSYYQAISPLSFGYSPYYYQRNPLVTVRAPHDGLILAVNRYFAGRLGMDPRYTISTNISRVISRTTGLAVTTSKRLFHGGVAGFVAAILRIFGMGVTGAIGAGALLWRWLESFDNSAYQR